MSDDAMGVLNPPNRKKQENEDPIEAYDNGYDDGYEDGSTGKKHGKSFDDMCEYDGDNEIDYQEGYE